MADWRQIGNGPAHLSNQLGETLNVGATTWDRPWRYPFQTLKHETLFAQIQPIVSAGHVVIGTLMGNLYSFVADATTGVASGIKAVEWVANIGGPIMSTVAADATYCYVVDLFGRLTAVTLSNGAIHWGPIQVTNGLPFQCSVLIADSKILIGGADGTFYARSLTDGSAIWSTTMGAPILQTAAWSSTSGTNLVIFGAQNGHTYALNSGTGVQVWDSGAANNAAAYKDYYPVIVGSRVIQRPMVRYPYWRNGDPAGLNTPIRGIEADALDGTAQTAARAAYIASPASYVRSLFVFDLADGADTASHQWNHYYWPITLNGAASPPCIDASDYAILGVDTPSGITQVNGSSCWGRLDPATGKFVDVLSHSSIVPNQNRDENMAPSACSNGVLLAHNEEGNAATPGFYRQSDSTWHPFGAAGTTELFVGNEAGGTNAMVVSDGLVYHHVHPHSLVCWQAS